MFEEFSYLQHLMNLFEKEGYEIYVVGGAVRDKLRGVLPHDIDLTTNARPLEMLSLAKQYDIQHAYTGEKYGTVTFYFEKEAYEITTFRKEKAYRDHRFPLIEYSDSLNEDLMRRDFTINAMAMNVRGQLIDPYGGQDDLKNKLIRTVLLPQERFEEDALRILRALRFSCTLDFTIEDETYQAMQDHAEDLLSLSGERIRDELMKMLYSDSDDVLWKLKDAKILETLMPEFIPTFDCAQQTPWHCYDVFDHMNVALNAANGYSAHEKLALFFHDIEKPSCISYDAHGQEHFYGHAKQSSLCAKSIMERLRFDRKTIYTVGKLIEYHDYRFHDTKKSLRKLMYNLKGDYAFAFSLIRIQEADNAGKNPEYCQEIKDELARSKALLLQMQDEKECVSIKDLAIDGNDLLSLGYQGEAIGLMLDELVRFVLNQQELNTKETLMKEAQRRKER